VTVTNQEEILLVRHPAQALQYCLVDRWSAWVRWAMSVIQVWRFQSPGPALRIRQFPGLDTWSARATDLVKVRKIRQQTEKSEFASLE
jgi:hypothetical protein